MGSCGGQPNETCVGLKNRREVAAIVKMMAYIPLAVCEGVSMCDPLSLSAYSSMYDAMSAPGV